MSLATHLRSSQAHGALRFRRDCPICRGERMMGPLEVTDEVEIGQFTDPDGNVVGVVKGS